MTIKKRTIMIPLIKMGEFTIYSFKDYKNEKQFFIKKENGEGMECAINKLEEVIRKFYEDNF